MKKLLIILQLLFFAICCQKNPIEPKYEDLPIPMGIDYSWKYSGSEMSPSYKISKIISTININSKKAYIIEEKWYSEKEETANFIFAWQWDEPFFKIYNKSGSKEDEWDPIMAFCLFDSGKTKWGYNETKLQKKGDIVSLPAGRLTYQDCYKYLKTDLFDSNNTTLFWIKEGIGMVKIESPKWRDYLVGYNF